MSNTEAIKLIQKLKALEAASAPKEKRTKVFNKIPTKFKVTVCLGCGKRYEDSNCDCPAGSSQQLRSTLEIRKLLGELK